MIYRTLSWSCGLAVMMAAGVVSAGQNTEWAQKMFDETSHDFGVVARGSDVQHRIKVTNIYEEDVHISDVKTSCGCTAATPSQNTLKSLESAYIEIKMDTVKFTRKKESSVIVTFDSPSYAVVRIPIAAYIRTDVVMDPGSVNFGSVDFGNGAERTIKVNYAGRDDWNIRGIENLPEYISADTVETSRRGQNVTYELKLQLNDDAPIGAFRGQIQLLTDDANSPKVPLLVEGEVTPEIVVKPDVISFGILKPGQEVTKSVVIRGKKPFKIGKIECESDLHAFKVRLPQEARPFHVVPLTISTPNGEGTLVEEFTITIEGRPDPVTFKAYGKVVSES